LSCFNRLEDDEAKQVAAKYLTKWRPGFADRLKAEEDQKKPEGFTEEVMADAVKVAEAAS